MLEFLTHLMPVPAPAAPACSCQLMLPGTKSKRLLTPIRPIARHESVPSFAASGDILVIMLVSIAIFCATCLMASATEQTAADSRAAPKNSSPDPEALLEAYEKTLVPYEQFKIKWTDRNISLKDGNKPVWLNTIEQTLVRDRNRLKYLARWESNDDSVQSKQNWEEDIAEKGKTNVSVHPASPGDDSHVPVIIAELHPSDADYIRTMRRGIPTGMIEATCIATFLHSSKLSAQRDTLEGRPVDVLQGVSGETSITLWLDPAMKHIPRKISYNRSSTSDSPALTLVFEVKRFEEIDGISVPVETTETQHQGARPAIGEIYAKTVNGKVVIESVPKKDEKGQIVMKPPSSCLTEVKLLDIQFHPKFTDEDFKISRPIPDGTKVSVNEPAIRHVSYEWLQGKVVKVIAPAIQGKFDPTTGVKAEIAKRLKTATWTRERVLVIFGANAWQRCASLEEVFLSNPETLLPLVDQQGAYSYQVVLADLTNSQNLALAAEYGLTLDDRQMPCITILESDGKVLCNQDLTAFEQDGRYDAEKIAAFLKKWEVPGENAEDVLRVALEQAAKEQKKPFVVVSGKHCVPCHRFINFLAERQDIFDQDYIFVKIDVDLMTQVAEVKARLGFASDIIPWYVILSPSGDRLITSNAPKENIGFPSTKQARDHFIMIIRQTASHITPEQLKAIEEGLIMVNPEI